MLINIKPWVRIAKSCFLRWKEIQFKQSWWLSEVLVCKKFPEENYSICQWRMIWEAFLPSGRLKLQFVNGRQKTADYMKMLNDLSLAQKGRRMDFIWRRMDFNAAIHNASISKKYLLEQKIRFLDHPVCSPDRKFVRVDCCKSLWRRLSVLSNFWIQKSNLRCIEKIPSVQLQKLVEVIKANGGSTTY